MLFANDVRISWGVMGALILISEEKLDLGLLGPWISLNATGICSTECSVLRSQDEGQARGIMSLLMEKNSVQLSHGSIIFHLIDSLNL